MRMLTMIALLALLAAPVAAETKYQSWSNPNTGAASARGFADKLNKLIDEAERDRAAAPGFLRDLRDLARSAQGTQGTRRRQVLRDDFTDGDFDRNPAWTVSEGRYWVEKGWGLRSSVTAATAAAEPKKMKRKDKALAFLGAVLNQSGRVGTVETNPPPPTVSAIHSRIAVANAFTMEFGLSSWQPQGRFDIGPWLGNDRASGYRLSYQPGGALTLLSVSGRGESVIARAKGTTPLEDKKSHAVIWSRDLSGRMTVSIDGKQVISATDQGFRDAFQGVSISNRGGDYIIKSITVFDGG